MSTYYVNNFRIYFFLNKVKLHFTSNIIQILCLEDIINHFRVKRVIK